MNPQIQAQPTSWVYVLSGLFLTDELGNFILDEHGNKIRASEH